MTLVVFLALLAALAGSSAAAAPACYDLKAGQPKALTGVLQYVLFAGPPNFEDVQKGDTPEPNFVLVLDRPICLRGDEFADPRKLFTKVQIAESDALSGKLKRYLRQRVTLTLTQQMAAWTGHHHEPLVAWATAVTSAARPMDFTDEYGTPATAIRTFYEALGEGQGDLASQMIVPEKRHLTNFSPTALSRFYGRLRTPLSLIDISTAGPDRFVAHYRYASAKTCDGRALITTVTRSGRNFIESIRALDGC
ncbi:MAG: hypothetical protein ABI306_06985 [Caulobacteraceae bacterium]